MALSGRHGGAGAAWQWRTSKPASCWGLQAPVPWLHSNKVCPGCVGLWGSVPLSFACLWSTFVPVPERAPAAEHAPPCGHCTGGREPGGGAACAHFPLEAASSKGRDPQALEPSTWLGAGDRNRTIVSSWCHRVIASQAAVPLVYVPLEAVASKWYGESERNLSEIFRAAEQMGGAIVFLDEIDSLATQRRSPSETPNTGHP